MMLPQPCFTKKLLFFMKSKSIRVSRQSVKQPASPNIPQRHFYLTLIFVFIYKNKVLFEPQTLLFCFSSGIQTRTALLGVTSTKALRLCGTTVPYPNVQKVKVIRSKEHAVSCNVSVKTKKKSVYVCILSRSDQRVCAGLRSVLQRHKVRH